MSSSTTFYKLESDFIGSELSLLRRSEILVLTWLRSTRPFDGYTNVTARGIAKELNLSLSTVYRSLKRLAAKGLVSMRSFYTKEINSFAGANKPVGEKSWDSEPVSKPVIDNLKKEGDVSKKNEEGLNSDEKNPLRCVQTTKDNTNESETDYYYSSLSTENNNTFQEVCQVGDGENGENTPKNNVNDSNDSIEPSKVDTLKSEAEVDDPVNPTKRKFPKLSRRTIGDPTALKEVAEAEAKKQKCIKTIDDRDKLRKNFPKNWEDFKKVKPSDFNKIIKKLYLLKTKTELNNVDAYFNKSDNFEEYLDLYCTVTGLWTDVDDWGYFRDFVEKQMLDKNGQVTNENNVPKSFWQELIHLCNENEFRNMRKVMCDSILNALPKMEDSGLRRSLDFEWREFNWQRKKMSDRQRVVHNYLYDLLCEHFRMSKYDVRFQTVGDK